MEKINNCLKLVLTDYWFEEIKSGRKTHEYRKVTSFWSVRIQRFYHNFALIRTGNWEEIKIEEYFVQFQKAYRKNPERMTFEIKNISMIEGLNTDLKFNGLVYDIELGEKVND